MGKFYPEYDYLPTSDPDIFTKLIGLGLLVWLAYYPYVSAYQAWKHRRESGENPDKFEHATDVFCYLLVMTLPALALSFFVFVLLKLLSVSISQDVGIGVFAFCYGLYLYLDRG